MQPDELEALTDAEWYNRLHLGAESVDEAQRALESIRAVRANPILWKKYKEETYGNSRKLQGAAAVGRSL